MNYTVDVLRDLACKLEDCRNGNEAWDVRDRWLRWWSEADAQLRNLFADSDVAASLYVSQARVRDVNLGAMPYGLLKHEIDMWLDRFTEMVDELMALEPFIERPGLIVVPDTSAFIESVYFTELNWQELADIDARKLVRLVVPVLVVEELDELKRGRDRARDRARSVLRRLWELNRDGKQAAVIPGRTGRVQQQPSALTNRDLIRPVQAADLRQRPSSTLVRLVGIEGSERFGDNRYGHGRGRV